MKVEDFEEINEMNDNHEHKKRFFVHKPVKSLMNLNENIFKNILNEIDSDTTDENSPVSQNNKKFSFKKKKNVKFLKIEIIRVESYKKYNKNNEFKHNNNNKLSTNEKCLIF